MTVYEKIDKCLRQHEDGKYTERSIDSLCDYIAWAVKWKKITTTEADEVCDRVCAILERDLTVMKGRMKNA
jgi:hypothetical protein